MGSGNSQPKQTQSQPVQRRQSSLHKDNRPQFNEGNFKNPPPLIYLHEIYEELTFNIDGKLSRPTRTISASDLFNIAVCYPYYCQSVHDMIRQAIRMESIRVAQEQPDYEKNFQYSESMDFGRVKAIERCKFRHKFRDIIKDTNSPCIQYKRKRDNVEVIQENEFDFKKLLQMFRYRWFQQNSQKIASLFANFNQITDTPPDNFRNKNIILPILSQLMGHDNCYAFIPQQNLVDIEIRDEFNELKNNLISSKPRCCMNFSPSEPLHSFDINGTILTHGICSNGKFLFVVTKEKILSIFLIYKGIIYRPIAKFCLPNNWELNERSFMFCSQKWLFIKDKSTTYQAPISELVCDDKINFKITNQINLQNIDKACSNGATYSIIGSEKLIKIFDADTDKLIMTNENPQLFESLRTFPPKYPIVTNGMYIGLLLDKNIAMITTYLQDEPLVYNKNDCFPKDFNLDVKAVTIDISSNIYYSVTYNGKNSIICSHPYTGSPDSYIFGLKLTDDLVNDTFESSLLRYLLPYAFSPIIPDNLIACSNPVETDIKSIVKWIHKFDDNIHLVKALLILIDLNFTKYDPKEIAQSLTPLLNELLINREYKRLVSALLVNHFDLFFNKIGVPEFKVLMTILYHLPNVNGNVFNEWAYNKLSQSVLLSKIQLSEEYVISIFTEKWISISRDEEPYSWGVNVLLIAQQNSFEEAVDIVEKDPLNFNKSELISIICSNAQFLIRQFLKVIEKVINDNKNKKNRKLDYDSILYTLISNFFASAAPITGCIQFANVITNKDAQKIIKLLNDEFEYDDTLQLFIGYFDMIYTASISTLIRGGSVYPCEDEFKWLIHGNFNNGNRNLTPPQLCQAEFFIKSLDNEIISIVSENLPYLYQYVKKFKFRNENTSIDPFLMAAITHQTNTVHLLSIRNDDNKIPAELNFICQRVKKLRHGFNSQKQKESKDKDDANSLIQKQTDKFIANIAILILLDPVFTDYLKQSTLDREQYCSLLEKFIHNNDPYIFHKVLKAIPTRINNVLNGFDRLNSLFKTIQNQAFHRIIIDGISRVDSFERLGYLLSHAELDERALNTLGDFHSSCISLIHSFHQISILEILYTVLATCKNFKKKAIEVMNGLTKYINPDKIPIDPFFMTVAGLAASTSAIPELLCFFPQNGKAYIVQLLFSMKNAPMLTVAELFSYIFNLKDENSFLNQIWIKMIFTIFIRCEDDEKGTLNAMMRSIFGTVAQRLNYNRCFVFSTLPIIVYGFRAILNLGNSLSIALQTLLASITIDSSIGEIFLLFAIIGGDISDYSMYYAIKNCYGKWLKYSNNDNEGYCLSIPITPLCERKTFDKNEITENVQDVELNLENGLSFDTILAFWDVCMKDQASLLCRLYLQTLTRYILTTNENISKENLYTIAKSAKPYINFHKLSSNQLKLYKMLSGSFKLTHKLLPEHEQGFGVIKQGDWTHLFSYNVMKFGLNTIDAIFLSDGYIIIHKKEPVILQVPSGVCNFSKEAIKIEDNIIHIKILNPQSAIAINNITFNAESNTSIEFIVKSINDIFLETNQYNFINSRTCSDNFENINAEYSNNIFLNDDQMNEFSNDLKSIQSVEYQTIDDQQTKRAGMNIIFNKTIDDYSFKEKLPFEGSVSMYFVLARKNEINICNQMKSVVLAIMATKNHQILDWPISFSLIKSAVVSISEFDRERFKQGLFPYHLEKGFFLNCSLNFIQNSNVQILYIAIKTLAKSEEFMNNLGKILVIMAQDSSYHSLIHKKDLVYIMKDDLKSFEHDIKNDYLVSFPNESKGKIEIDDSGSWIDDTPIVFLLLLWFFIDNCSNSNQRICAKLAVVDCMLIQSPMIDKYMPEFLTYIQNKLLFMPDDFNPIYIHHLSTLALKNPNNPQIFYFYECEKNCFNKKTILHSYISQTLDFNQIEGVNLNKSEYKLTLIKMTELIQLLKNYKSIDYFPIWQFLPIWKTISSTTYELYTDMNDTCVKEDNHAFIFNQFDVFLLCTIVISNNLQVKVHNVDNDDDESSVENIDLCQYKDTYFGYYIVKPNETKQFVWQCEDKSTIKIQMYKIIQNNQFTYENLLADIKSFAVDWNDFDTEDLLQECADFNFKCNDFMFILLKALNMSDLIQKFGVHIVLCKLYCIFMLDSYYEVFNESSIDHLSQEDDEIRRLGREYSRFFPYQNRIGQFSIQATEADRQRTVFLMVFLSLQFDSMTFDNEASLRFVNGESENYHDSMIYQLSEAIKNYSVNKFKSIIWGVSFKGSESLDMRGVTNQTITMAINSFLYQKTGLCIISPNSNGTLVIPYPTKDDQSTKNMLFAFGTVLGSMIRNGISQDIPFPLFIWNFLAGKPITTEDVYENDTRLRDQISEMKSGQLKDHHWTYRDWDNLEKPIQGFSEDMIVTQNLAEIYEMLVINLRIKSLVQNLSIIREGFWTNQNIKDPAFLSGGLISFLCQGKKIIDIQEIVKRFVFKKGNKQLRNNFISVISEYDQESIKKFLLFVTAKQRPPNFSVVPDYHITVIFDDGLPVTGFPQAHTCVNGIDVPIYPTLDIMKEKLNLAILYCNEMDNK